MFRYSSKICNKSDSSIKNLNYEDRSVKLSLYSLANRHLSDLIETYIITYKLLDTCKSAETDIQFNICNRTLQHHTLCFLFVQEFHLFR